MGVELVLRTGRAEDAGELGRIFYEAFGKVAADHGFPSEVPSRELAREVMETSLSHPGIYGVVAELDGRIVGSNFLDERSPVVCVGPVSVDPDAQDGGIGRRLMQDVMKRAAERRAPGIRLLQSSYHTRSFALYAGLGFAFRETIACLQGAPVGHVVPGYEVRPATDADLVACNELCRRVHGLDRGGEVVDALKQGTARVVEHDGRITGYATDVSFFGHAVGETTEDIKALIGAATSFDGLGILVPASNSALLRWCLGHGLRVVELMSLMTVGVYNEPAGAYLPSILS